MLLWFLFPLQTRLTARYVLQTKNSKQLCAGNGLDPFPALSSSRSNQVGNVKLCGKLHINQPLRFCQPELLPRSSFLLVQA